MLHVIWAANDAKLPDRRMLQEAINRSPEKLLLACSCTLCVTHLNFMQSDAQAVQFTPVEEPRVPPPPAGGCRESASQL